MEIRMLEGNSQTGRRVPVYLDNDNILVYVQYQLLFYQSIPLFHPELPKGALTFPIFAIFNTDSKWIFKAAAKDSRKSLGTFQIFSRSNP
jgi:hypothetical protein